MQTSIWNKPSCQHLPNKHTVSMLMQSLYYSYQDSHVSTACFSPAEAYGNATGFIEAFYNKPQSWMHWDLTRWWHWVITIHPSREGCVNKPHLMGNGLRFRYFPKVTCWGPHSTTSVRLGGTSQPTSTVFMKCAGFYLHCKKCINSIMWVLLRPQRSPKAASYYSPVQQHHSWPEW